MIDSTAVSRILKFCINLDLLNYSLKFSDFINCGSLYSVIEGAVDFLVHLNYDPLCIVTVHSIGVRCAS